MTSINLEQYGILVSDIARNPALAQLYREAMLFDPQGAISVSGAMIA